MIVTSESPSYARALSVGFLAHCSEVLLMGHLLDRIKTEQEAHPQLSSVKKSLQSIIENGGWKALYKGLRWSVALSAFKGANGWGIHNLCNRYTLQIYPQKEPRAPSLPFTMIVSGTTAFIETTLILCPLERLKTFTMTYQQSQTPLWDKIKKDKITFFYQGWSRLMLRQGCTWTSYLVVYQIYRDLFIRYTTPEPLSFQQKIALGILTGSSVAIINAPLDLLKTQAQKADALQYQKINHTIHNIYQTFGWKGMYRSLPLKILRTSYSFTWTLLLLNHFEALPQNMKL